jgi:hypothetical protein
MLPLMEEFYTIQAGFIQERLRIFAWAVVMWRLLMVWCKESWMQTRIHLPTLTRLLTMQQSGIKTIVITGGEPHTPGIWGPHNTGEERGMTVHIETSGAYPMCVGTWDWICLSPKSQDARCRESMFVRTRLKMIVTIKWFRFRESGSTKEVSATCLFLQPEWSVHWENDTAHIRVYHGSPDGVFPFKRRYRYTLGWATKLRLAMRCPNINNVPYVSIDNGYGERLYGFRCWRQIHRSFSTFESSL